MKLSQFSGLIAIAAALVVITPAGAEYPDRPLCLIVPFPPGGFSKSESVVSKNLND